MKKLYKANELSFKEMASLLVWVGNIVELFLQQKAIISLSLFFFPVLFATTDQNTAIVTIANYCQLQ